MWHIKGNNLIENDIEDIENFIAYSKGIKLGDLKAFFAELFDDKFKIMKIIKV